MLLHVIFLYCISAAVGSHGFFSFLFRDTKSSDNNDTTLKRTPRDTVVKDKNVFELNTISCDDMARTSSSPYVVLILLRTSGRFLGMGSIIDKQTVLTAKRVVENIYQKPRELRILAGRLGPWWGKDSQVKVVNEIILNDDQLALLKADDPFTFNKNVGIVKLHQIPEEMFDMVFGQDYVVFGVPRSSWDIPGERAPKGSTYVLKTETALQKMDDIDLCKATFPNYETFNDTFNMCASANGSYCWGCIGSPTMALNEQGELFQVALITHTSTTESDVFHIHTLVAYFDAWIRSQTNIKYKTAGT